MFLKTLDLETKSVKYTLETTEGYKFVDLKTKGQELLEFLGSCNVIVELEIIAAMEIPPENKYCIWVNIHAPWSALGFLGYYLGKCHVYLQHPLFCNRNVPYQNSQTLSVHDNVIYHTPSLQHYRKFIHHQDAQAVQSKIVERRVEFIECDREETYADWCVTIKP